MWSPQQKDRFRAQLNSGRYATRVYEVGVCALNQLTRSFPASLPHPPHFAPPPPLSTCRPTCGEMTSQQDTANSKRGITCRKQRGFVELLGKNRIRWLTKSYVGLRSRMKARRKHIAKREGLKCLQDWCFYFKDKF